MTVRMEERTCSVTALDDAYSLCSLAVKYAVTWGGYEVASVTTDGWTVSSSVPLKRTTKGS